MKQQHPVVERYMTHLETALRGLDPADRDEVLHVRVRTRGITGNSAHACQPGLERL